MGCDDAKVKLMGQQTDWSYSSQAINCVDEQCLELEHKIFNIIDQCVPTTILKTTKEGIPLRKAPWECSKLRRARKAKDKAWHCFDNSPSHFNLVCALEAQEMYEVVESRSKERYEIKLAKSVKHNSRRFFAYLRCKKKSNSSVSCLKKPNGELTTSPAKGDCGCAC